MALHPAAARRLLPVRPCTPLDLHGQAAALMADPATRPDHLLSMADAFDELATTTTGPGTMDVTNAIQALAHHLRDAAPAYGARA